MLSRNNHNESHTAQIVYLDDLIPKDHIVRKLNKSIDFSFIYTYTEPMYSTVGRPSIDPVVLFKLAFINRMFGYNSMRRTIKEVEVNLAYRWFLGLSLTDKIPHFSDFSANYKRKFSIPIDFVDSNGEVVVSSTLKLVH